MTRRFVKQDVYEGAIISRVKKSRALADPRKKDLEPATLDFGPVRFILARHFGFCYGVENAVEIAYKTIDENPDRRVFFLSEMIHNPKVNGDLMEQGVRFIMSPTGEQLIPWEELGGDDVVVVPAFGTTLELQEKLKERGIDAYKFDTTCPFVEKVWKRSSQLGSGDFTVVIHGKAAHEETRATFSHSVRAAPTVIVRDMEEAGRLGEFITGARPSDTFEEVFDGRCSDGFDAQRHLERIGVVNQTTMLATETRAIAAHLRACLIERFGEAAIAAHFADTADTLCYATNENQNATYALIERGADLAIVVGGYNSSNTSHLVELCERAMPTFFIKGAAEIDSTERIRHFSLDSHSEVETDSWLPAHRPLDVVLTCGASCPDAILDEVLLRVLSLFDDTQPIDGVLNAYPV